MSTHHHGHEPDHHHGHEPEPEHVGPHHLTTRPFNPLPLCPAIVLGWVAYDMASFGMQGNPDQAQALLPGTAVALILGCIAGRLWQDWPRFLELLAGVALLGCLAPLVIELPGGEDVRWLPRCILAQCLVLLGLGKLAGKRWLPLGTLACAAGALLAIGLAWLLEFRAGQKLSWDLPTQLTLGAVLLAVLPATLPRARSLPFGALAALLWLSSVAYLGHGAQELRRPDRPVELKPTSAQPNLLMVVLDTVRADHLPAYGHHRHTTPNLDRLVGSRATRYANATATSSWTLPSHASLFTGLYPDEHGATRPRPEDDSGLNLQAWPACALRPDVPTLAERLQEAGYQTAAVVGNITFLRHEFGLDRGFAHYDDRISTYLPKRIALAQMFGKAQRVGALPYRDARVVTDHALSWLEQHFATPQAAPFFLMLNYMDAHAPQLPEPPYDHAFETPLPDFGSDARGLAARKRYLDELAYDRGLFYADSQFGRVLKELEHGGELDNTVVVVTSDHGEAFGEHGYWLHGWHLHQETLNVPLFIKQAGEDAEARVETKPVTGADVQALVLEALGLPAVELRDAEGSQLADGMLGQLYMTEYLIDKFAKKNWKNPGLNQIAWLEAGRKVLVSRDGPVQAFDPLTDPEELRPLPLSEEELQAARARAEAWWLAHPPLGIEGAALSDEDRDRLGDLGYTGDEEE